MRIRILLVGLQLFLSTVAFTQVRLKSSVEIAPGFEANIFNSPDIYQDLQGTILTEDDLLQNAAFMHFDARFKLEKRRNKNDLSWSNNLELRNYNGLRQANTFDFDSKVNLKRTINKKRTFSAEGRFRNVSRLGVNVLGSELQTPFSFLQYELSSEFVSRHSKRFSSTFAGEMTYKDYDVCVDCGLRGEDVSLSQLEFDLSIKEEIELSDDDKKTNQLNLSARFRDRRYFDWVAYDLIDPRFDGSSDEPFLAYDPDLNYENRRWRYLTFKVEHALDVSKTIKVKPVLEFTRRFDISNGDFGFQQLQPGVNIYARSKNWSARCYLSYTRRNYTDRIAKQRDVFVYPTLEYSYTRAKIKFEHRIRKAWFAFTELSYVSRNSNVTEIRTRVRRSYENVFMMLGVKWNWKKTLATKNK
jgi:hypothetical protein